MPRVRIVIEVDDDLWGFAQAIADGADPSDLKDLALEEPQFLIEESEIISVEVVD